MWISDALGTGTQACPIDWDRISTIKLNPKASLHGTDTLMSVREAQQKGKAIIINNIDRFVFSSKRYQLIQQMEAVKDC
jgi:hypothetical protein